MFFKSPVGKKEQFIADRLFQAGVTMDPVREQLLKNMGFSEKAIAILDQNLNMGKLTDASVSAQHQGACGDILFLFLKISQDIISEARFEYIGCAGLQVCASALTELIKGLTLDKAGQARSPGYN